MLKQGFVSPIETNIFETVRAARFPDRVRTELPLYIRLDQVKLCKQRDVREAALGIHDELRAKIPLLAQDEQKEWDAKLSFAARIRDLIKERKQYLDTLLDKYSSQAKPQLQKQIIELKKSTRLNKNQEELLGELKLILGLQTRTSDIFKNHAFSDKMDYQKFKAIAQFVINQSGQEDLIAFINDEEILALATCLSVKSRHFSTETKDAFLKALPERFLGNKDPDHYQHLAVLARYIFLELCKLKTAVQVEGFENWDTGVFDLGFDKIRKHTNPIDYVRTAFPRLVEGTNPIIRPWELRFARWSKPEYAKDLAASACAWFLLHHVKAVKEDGSYDVTKMRKMSEWLKELQAAGLDSMFICCPYTKDLLSIFKLGANRLYELGIAKQENLVGIGQDQFRPWDYIRNNSSKDPHHRDLARLELAMKLYDAGLGTIEISNNRAIWTFSGQQLMEWNKEVCPRLGFVSLDNFLRKNAEVAYSKYGKTLDGTLRFLFNEKFDLSTAKSTALIRKFNTRRFEIDFDMNRFPEFPVQKDVVTLDAWDKKISTGKWLAAIIMEENNLEGRSNENLKKIQQESEDIAYRLEYDPSFKPDLKNSDRRRALNAAKVRIRACKRILELKDARPTFNPRASIVEIESFLRSLSEFNEMPYNRVVLLMAVISLLKTDYRPHGLLESIPEGLVKDEKFCDQEDNAILFRYIRACRNQMMNNSNLKDYNDALKYIGLGRFLQPVK